MYLTKPQSTIPITRVTGTGLGGGGGGGGGRVDAREHERMFSFPDYHAMPAHKGGTSSFYHHRMCTWCRGQEGWGRAERPGMEEGREGG